MSSLSLQAPDTSYTSSRALLLLKITALGAILFTFAGGLFVFQKTRQFDTSVTWLEHTHEVIDLLLLQSTRIDRTEASLQLNQVKLEDGYARSAANSMVALNLGVLRLEDLVRDNPAQTEHAHALGKALQTLTQAVDRSQQERTIPAGEIRECRNTLNVMLNEERGLLDQRTATSKQTLLRSYMAVTTYMGMSLLLLVVAFGSLLRDVKIRRASECRLSLANSSLAASVETLGILISEAAMLKDAREELQLCVSAQQAYDTLARHMERAVPGSSGATMIINNSRSMLVSLSTWNQPTAVLDGFDASACCGLRVGSPRWRKAGESEVHCGHFLGIPPENYICIPLAALGEMLGFVYIDLPTAEAVRIAEARLAMLYKLVEVAAMGMAGLNLRAKLENQSIRDGLTKLFNRHFMEISLERELQRADRNKTPVALLMLDVDHFKEFNDTFGHAAGDLILQKLAHCLEATVRSGDIVCRYGGEEFVVILPETSDETALARAEEIRRRVSEIQIEFRGEQLRAISISVGLAMYPNPAKDAVDLLRIADRGLYKAKKAGRNQVQVLAA